MMITNKFSRVNIRVSAEVKDFYQGISDDTGLPVSTIMSWVLYSFMVRTGKPDVDMYNQVINDFLADKFNKP